MSESSASDPSATGTGLSEIRSSADPPPPEKPRRRIGLLAKTTVMLLFVGLAPLMAFGIYTLSHQKTLLHEDAVKSMQVNAEYLAKQVDEWFDKNFRVLHAATNLASFTSMQRDEQTKVLVAIKKAYPWMYLVMTIGLDGKNVARSDDAALADYADRKYFKDIATGGKDRSWEAVISKTSGKPAFLVSMPIRVDGKLVGVLAAGMTIEQISKSVANWKSGSTGFAFLVDETAKVLAHPRQDFVLQQKKLPDHPMIRAYQADHQAHLLSFADTNTETLGYVRGNEVGWAVVVQQSQDELLAPLHSTTKIAATLLVAALLLVTGIGVLASRMMVRPIVAMTTAADRMSMGDLKTPLTSRGNDEIATLAHSLERLRKSLRAAMKRL